jgi:hypothetical protein
MEMHYIACAFGNRGWTNMHTHWRFQPFSSILLMVVEIVVPWPKVPRRNLVHHVCCSHVITTRGALGILVGSMQLTANPCSPLYVIPLLPTDYMGKQVMLTSITSIISHEHVHFFHYASGQVHHMFICTSIMCSSACASHSMHHKWALKCVSLHCCTKYSLFIAIQSHVSLVHNSFNLKLFMWAKIFWHCCTNPHLKSFPLLSINNHEQLLVMTLPSFIVAMDD